jgi:hypothetical protein
MELRKMGGWTATSARPSRYIHQTQRDVENKMLKKAAWSRMMEATRELTARGLLRFHTESHRQRLLTKEPKKMLNCSLTELHY